MPSVNGFCAPFPPSDPSPLRTGQDRILPARPASFARIPSWVSLNRTSSAKPPPTAQQGHVENLHLVSLSRQGKFEQVHEFIKSMDEAGVAVSPSTYKSLFEACGEMGLLSDGRSIRDRLKNPPGFLEDCALQMYCDCGSLSEARRLFDKMPERSSFAWGTMMSAYAQSGVLDKAFQLFSLLIDSGVGPKFSVYTSLLRSLMDSSCLEIGRQMHSHLIRTGSGSNASVGTAICNMYVKCGWLEGARIVFDQMAEKKVVAWTALMVGCTEANKQNDVLPLFMKMVEEGVELDEFAFSIVLKACAWLEDLRVGRQIHGYIVKLGLESEVSVGTPLVDLYVKCTCFESALLAFQKIDNPNDVSWSTLISGYSQSGRVEECLKTYKSLRVRDGSLNPFIYTSIFQACSMLADINSGAQAHADAIKRGLISPLYGESALITMYSKCGNMDYASRVFKSISEPDTIAWTAIIAGYAYHGIASEALRYFRKMQDSGARPNGVTLVAVLTACSHSSLITEAKGYLKSMNSEYGVAPTVDHFNCMIDVYSRAGLLQEAFELINSMNFEPDAMSWKCLLAGCWNHRNLELGRIASENLLRLNPDDTAGYILLFNLCVSHEKWEEAARIRKKMMEKKLRKEVSCSWITVKGKWHRFIVGDRHHPQTEEIYAKLKEIDFLDSNSGDRSQLTEEDASCILPERRQQLLEHSERLAIAFGLLSSPRNSPVLIFKNLRACRDCHDFAKHVSTVTEREIVIRDSSRFHHFKLGQCSCCDYW
ncbi:pentatricopeptide repeat-containing protein At5g13270, chloroplastic [Eucalyptus grandis]|uniref:pentatricopeptide repeat-containing protein At5g13270, chloroplastic n=1 Tax=Eucalyptus grandis TaxID=71139 RepID=UPI00192E986A|nr:pentatricopeptide repeat-containing protein At5g13270, chloroplastic [Eucalyptus grandis]